MSCAQHLPVLMYHHVSNKPGLVTLSPRTFRAQMKWLAESGWKTVTAAEVEHFWRGGILPRKSVMLTFDDGWLDNWLQVFPVLREFNLHAHIFLVTGLISEGPVRLDSAQPEYTHAECEARIEQGRSDEVMLRWSEIREMRLSGLVEFHLHSHTHKRRDQISCIRSPLDFLKSDLHLGMDDCVLMCGLVRPVMPVYQHASLLVLPSRNESFGMVAVEAAACGVPVMASQTGGIPSVIQDGETGTLLPPDDGVAWRNALRVFLDNPAQAQEMAARAEEDLERLFSIYYTVDRLLSLGQLDR